MQLTELGLLPVHRAGEETSVHAEAFVAAKVSVKEPPLDGRTFVVIWRDAVGVGTAGGAVVTVVAPGGDGATRMESTRKTEVLPRRA